MVITILGTVFSSSTVYHPSTTTFGVSFRAVVEPLSYYISSRRLTEIYIFIQYTGLVICTFENRTTMSSPWFIVARGSILGKDLRRS